jgi:hypothetical protein
VRPSGPFVTILDDRLARVNRGSLSWQTDVNIEFVPLLQIQRDLYSISRGPERFTAYLKTMVSPDGTDVRLPPLVTMNPMGKDHLPALLDSLLAIGAEATAADASTEAANQLDGTPGNFKLGLVVADDLKGGWTNRYASEFFHRFEGPAAHKRGWLSAWIWSSETPTLAAVREEVQGVVFRAAYVIEHGAALNLADMLAQEGNVMAMAGCSEPSLDAPDLDYTREVLRPHLQATDLPTLIPCLFGDSAAHALGYPPQGLTHRAGLALALSEAQLGARSPDSVPQ